MLVTAPGIAGLAIAIMSIKSLLAASDRSFIELVSSPARFRLCLHASMQVLGFLDLVTLIDRELFLTLITVHNIR